MRALPLSLSSCPPSLISFRQCSTCPDSTNCARLLEDKWRQAYNAVFRFGSCPSFYTRHRLCVPLTRTTYRPPPLA